jgi:hypothetical protein
LVEFDICCAAALVVGTQAQFASQASRFGIRYWGSAIDRGLRSSNSSTATLHDLLLNPKHSAPLAAKITTCVVNPIGTRQCSTTEGQGQGLPLALVPCRMDTACLAFPVTR